MRLQQRLEGGVVGQLVISLVILATLATILAINLPESHLRREVSKVAQPYANALGVDQAWGVFAPDPRREVIGLVARINYADGTSEDWEPPRRGALVGGYSDYHWRKLEENATLKEGDPVLGEQLATWVARQRPGRRVVSVMLLKRALPIQRPGARQQQSAPAENQFYNYQVQTPGAP